MLCYELFRFSLLPNHAFGLYACEWLPVERNVIVFFEILKTPSRFALTLWLQLQKYARLSRWCARSVGSSAKKSFLMESPTRRCCPSVSCRSLSTNSLVYLTCRGKCYALSVSFLRNSIGSPPLGTRRYLPFFTSSIPLSMLCSNSRSSIRKTLVKI